jgi:chromate reductase
MNTTGGRRGEDRSVTRAGTGMAWKKRPPIRIAAISGSLRAASSSASLLRAAARLAPGGVAVSIADDLGRLPHFNPDHDADGVPAPESVAAFRALLANAHAVILCTPEYAHGVPGVLKNALDWAVSSGELRGKPMGLIVAAPGGGAGARESLTRTLQVMEARIVPDASLTLRNARQVIGVEGTVLDPSLAREIQRVLGALAAAATPLEAPEEPRGGDSRFRAGGSGSVPLRLNLADRVDPPVSRGSRP